MAEKEITARELFETFSNYCIECREKCKFETCPLVKQAKEQAKEGKNAEL